MGQVLETATPHGTSIFSVAKQELAEQELAEPQLTEQGLTRSEMSKIAAEMAAITRTINSFLSRVNEDVQRLEQSAVNVVTNHRGARL